MSLRISSLNPIEAQQLLGTTADNRSFIVCKPETDDDSLTLVYSGTSSSEVITQRLPDTQTIERIIFTLSLKGRDVSEELENNFREMRNPEWYEEISIKDTSHNPYNLQLINYEQQLAKRLKAEEAGTFLICYETAKKVYHLYSKRCIDRKTQFEKAQLKLSRKGYTVTHATGEVGSYTAFTELCQAYTLARGLYSLKTLSAAPPQAHRPKPVNPRDWVSPISALQARTFQPSPLTRSTPSPGAVGPFHSSAFKPKTPPTPASIPLSKPQSHQPDVSPSVSPRPWLDSYSYAPTSSDSSSSGSHEPPQMQRSVSDPRGHAGVSPHPVSKDPKKSSKRTRCVLC